LLATSAAKADEDDGSVTGGPVAVGRKGETMGGKLRGKTENCSARTGWGLGPFGDGDFLWSTGDGVYMGTF